MEDDIKKTAEELQETRNADGTFKKGVSGNPAGRIKGKRHITTRVKEALLKISDGEEETYEVRLVKKILTKAVDEGDPMMIKMIWEMIDGKATQTLAGDEEAPVVLQLNSIIAKKNGIEIKE